MKHLFFCRRYRKYFVATRLFIELGSHNFFRFIKFFARVIKKGTQDKKNNVWLIVDSRSNQNSSIFTSSCRQTAK